MQNNQAELKAVSSALVAEARYVPWSGTHKVVPKERLRAAGWRVTKGMRPVTQVTPEEWVDTETGELFTAAEARKQGIKLPRARSTSDRAMDLAARVGACTPSERPFVGCLLQLRNHRGGLVATLDTILDRWIDAKCPGMWSTDKARKRKQLRAIIERRGLMVNDTTMAKDLMLFNPNLTKQQMMEESAKLYTVLPVSGDSPL
jgi:hypothetical protein